MFNKKIKLPAFTLSELLIAIGIVGIIAAMSIPSLMENLNKRLLSAQIKNFIGNIQQLANDQLTIKQSRNLADTDFDDVEKLLSDKNFQIAKTCKNGTAQSECWKVGKTVGTGDNAVYISTYKFLDGANASPDERLTIILKNGAIISYKKESGDLSDGDSLFGYFDVDVNGNDKPNKIGRDFYSFRITKKGRIMGTKNADGTAAKCKSNDALSCIDLLLNSNWVMEY
ncbi:hypothetical protein IJ541_03035 [bacterium]|nr:hypothetical protein [bacterium]